MVSDHYGRRVIEIHAALEFYRKHKADELKPRTARGHRGSQHNETSDEAAASATKKVSFTAETSDSGKSDNPKPKPPRKPSDQRPVKEVAHETPDGLPTDLPDYSEGSLRDRIRRN